MLVDRFLDFIAALKVLLKLSERNASFLERLILDKSQIAFRPSRFFSDQRTFFFC